MNQAKHLKPFTVGNEDIFAATDEAQVLELANVLFKTTPPYGLDDVEQVADRFLNRPWGSTGKTLQEQLAARTESGYLAGWQD